MGRERGSKKGSVAGGGELWWGFRVDRAIEQRGCILKAIEQKKESIELIFDLKPHGKNNG